MLSARETTERVYTIHTRMCCYPRDARVCVRFKWCDICASSVRLPFDGSTVVDGLCVVLTLLVLCLLGIVSTSDTLFECMGDSNCSNNLKQSRVPLASTTAGSMKKTTRSICQSTSIYSIGHIHQHHGLAGPSFTFKTFEQNYDEYLG